MIQNYRVVLMWVLFGWWSVQQDVALAQNTPLQIKVRDYTGTAVSGETVTLERLPEEEPILPTCTTDTNGICTWYVGRGLYQVVFSHPLDKVSALALAEGGLRGFGLTVGEADVTYHFTFHNDDHVYFDASPDLPVPSPIIPSLLALQGGAVPTPALSQVGVAITNPTATATNHPLKTAESAQPSPWPTLSFVLSGILLGGGLHIWFHKRKGPNRPIHSPVDSQNSRSPLPSAYQENQDA